ncbi:MAG TPA: GNAT family N-acetyltransferase [Streptosporangiaceae bacterium]|nr:GNAT family N-acetyltransferase [Streptosporangiaceae bacterium]
MDEPYPVRPITEDEFAGMYAIDEHAFHTPWPAEPEIQHFSERFEFDRSLAAFDGAVIAGSACVFSIRLGVPGAVLPAAGVSGVSVLPPHRRRGILRSLMTRQLADIHDRDEPIAALWASEAGIYGRFGYGMASTHASFNIRRGDGRLTPDAPSDPGLLLRIAEPRRARQELAKVYDALLPYRPGSFIRDDRWWDAVLYDPGYRRDGSTPLRCLLAEDASGPRGYALYAASPHWDDDGIPGGTIRIRELMADGPAAAAALWRDLLSRDLTGSVVARNRPIDDPLLHLLADPRRARARFRDGLWIRLVDLPAALTQRRYAAAADVVIEVADEACPWNTGRWRLRAQGPTGAAVAECGPTGDPADLRMPVAALGAAYLGGTGLGALAGAGVIKELRPGAVAAASAALSWDPAPWCPMVF